MLSTATMVRLGYVTGNRMSHLKAGNTKLRERAVRIVMAETGVDQQRAAKALEDYGWVVTDAIKVLN
jgi:N-acetylmuramic acid 6-phosphate etherase